MYYREVCSEEFDFFLFNNIDMSVAHEEWWKSFSMYEGWISKYVFILSVCKLLQDGVD